MGIGSLACDQKAKAKVRRADEAKLIPVIRAWAPGEQELNLSPLECDTRRIEARDDM